jgi:hypothetical protein
LPLRNEPSLKKAKPARRRAASQAHSKRAAAKKKKEYKHRHPLDSTEASLTADLSLDLKDAWKKIRAFGEALGSQRIYASGWAIMFSRKNCYFFVRPKKSFLEVCIFLPRKIDHPMVKRSTPSSKTKFAVLCNILHEDQVEAPLTGWIREAFDAMPAEQEPKPIA